MYVSNFSLSFSERSNVSQLRTQTLNELQHQKQRLIFVFSIGISDWKDKPHVLLSWKSNNWPCSDSLTVGSDQRNQRSKAFGSEPLKRKDDPCSSDSSCEEEPNNFWKRYDWKAQTHSPDALCHRTKSFQLPAATCQSVPGTNKRSDRQEKIRKHNQCSFFEPASGAISPQHDKGAMDVQTSPAPETVFPVVCEQFVPLHSPLLCRICWT